MLLCYQRELPGYKHRNKDRLFDLVRSLRGWGGRAISKNKKKKRLSTTEPEISRWKFIVVSQRSQKVKDLRR